METKTEKEKVNKTGYISGRIFMCAFLLITAFFTALNFYEFAADLEPDGHVKGIAQLELVRNYGVDAWGAMQKLMCKRMAFGSTVYSDVAILDNGYATMPDLYPDIVPAEEGASDAYEFAKAHGIEFLYVQACGKEETDADLPFGVESSAGDKAARMTEFLNEQEIPNLSVRDMLERDGGEWYGYFYRTDHHMRNNAAFIIACEMGRYINEKNGSETDADWMNADNYSRTEYKDVFLGTHGRMTGRFFTGLDDYELWLPKWKTKMSLDVPSQGIQREGDFEDAFVYYENLAGYSFDYYAYYAYLHQDYDHMILRNENAPNDMKLVIVRDSTAVAVSPFLIHGCSEIHLLDLRYMSADEDVYGIIEDIDPDWLIYLFGPGYLGNEGAVKLR
ncbi:MAG: hypothetical protein IKO53_07625 [Lachnospiraceae bacterium]|nr:hypothetical protein [Lachnospiraceae bacterium]